MHPSGRTRERTPAFSASAYVLPALGSNLGPKRTSSAPRCPPAGGRRRGLGGSLPCKWTTVPCWALGRPWQGLKPERHRRRAKFDEKGLPGYPHRGLQPPSPFPAGPEARDTDKPRGAPTGVSVWIEGGDARSRSPKVPRSPAPAARQLCAPVGPRGHRQTAGSAAGSPGGPCSGPEPRGRGRAGGVAVWFCFPSTPLDKLSPGAGSPGFPRQPRPPPWVHSPPRPAARAPRCEPRGGRPGHCAAGGASCGDPCPDPGRAEPRRVGRSLRSRGAPSSGLEPRSGSLCTPVAARRERGGGPFIYNTEESAFQPSPAPTHSRTHTHPGAGRVAHLSPKSC